jgi:hypothetical protein
LPLHRGPYASVVDTIGQAGTSENPVPTNFSELTFHALG